MLGGAFLSCACQHDSNVAFDDSQLPSEGSDTAGSASTSTGGSQSTTAGESGGGSSALGGKPGASGGAAGKPSGGSGGKPTTGEGGKAGGATGGMNGTAGKAGTAGAPMGGASTGGASTGGVAGMAGMANPDPDPIVYETADIDDSSVSACLPNTNFGLDESLNVDGDAFCVVQTLITAPLADVPDNAIVQSASLTLDCINVGGAITVSYVNGEWKETTVRWTNRPEAGTNLGSVQCKVLGPVVIDLKAAVTAWLSGAHKNFGIYLRMETTDGSDFSSSDNENANLHPVLNVTYTLPQK
jgi:hypothetical protein